MSRSVDRTDTLSILSGGHLPTPEGAPSASMLEAFPNSYAGRLYVIELTFPEFTSLCPVTGQPDFGSIRVVYIPDARCVESKSFKLYMFAFRTHHSFMETMTNKILEDLCLVLDPLWCQVQGFFAPRGGIRINVQAEHYKDAPQEEVERIRRVVNDYRRETGWSHAGREP